MTLKNDATVLYEPTKLVRASGRVPKTLRFIDEEGNKEEYFVEPQIEGNDLTKAKIFYTLPTKFARRLLADARFKLVSPEKMFIRVRNLRTYDYDTKIVKACGEKPSGNALADEDIEALNVKRAEKEIDEQTSLPKGDTPAHMQSGVKATEQRNKKEEKRVANEIEEKQNRPPHGESVLGGEGGAAAPGAYKPPDPRDPSLGDGRGPTTL